MIFSSYKSGAVFLFLLISLNKGTQAGMILECQDCENQETTDLAIHNNQGGGN